MFVSVFGQMVEPEGVQNVNTIFNYACQKCYQNVTIVLATVYIAINW